MFWLNKCDIDRDALVSPDFHQEFGTDSVNCSHSVKLDLFSNESKPKICFSRCPPDRDPGTHEDITDGGAVAAQHSLLWNYSIRFTPAKLKQICSFWIIVSFCFLSFSLGFLNECRVLCSRTVGTGPWVSFYVTCLVLHNFSSDCWMLISQT